MNNKKELVFANSFLSNTQATLIGSPVKFVKMQSVKSFTLITLTALVLTACGDKAPAGAGSATSTDVKARQDLMQDWRGANDILKGMMENPTNFDVATLKSKLSSSVVVPPKCGRTLMMPMPKATLRTLYGQMRQAFKPKKTSLMLPPKTLWQSPPPLKVLMMSMLLLEPWQKAVAVAIKFIKSDC